MHARVSLSLWHLYSKQLRTSLCAYRIYLFLMLFVKDKYYTQTSIQRTSDIFCSLYCKIYYILTFLIVQGAGICSLNHKIHYIATLLIVKGAGICSLRHETHYIKIHDIEVWVYIVF